MKAGIEELRRFAHSRLGDVRRLLYSDVSRARQELARHVNEIVLRPEAKAGKRYYMASGQWNLIEGKEFTGGGLEMVAGAGFEPATFGL